MSGDNDDDLAGIDADGIEKTIEAYFDGLYRSDVDALRRIFHPVCQIIGYDSRGVLQTMSLDDFLGFVATVPSPSDAGAPFDMDTLAIDATPTTASVAVRDAYIGRDFIDYLLMVLVDGTWMIVAKGFHSEPLGI